jgi:antitoxin ParD1/3/4
MQTMNISLPEAMKVFVESEVAAGGYSTVSELIRELVREAQKRKARAKVAALLREGLNSKSSEMTQADWDELKRRVRFRARKRKAAKYRVQ